MDILNWKVVSTSPTRSWISGEKIRTRYNILNFTALFQLWLSSNSGPAGRITKKIGGKIQKLVSSYDFQIFFSWNACSTKSQTCWFTLYSLGLILILTRSFSIQSTSNNGGMLQHDPFSTLMKKVELRPLVWPSSSNNGWHGEEWRAE